MRIFSGERACARPERAVTPAQPTAANTAVGRPIRPMRIHAVMPAVVRRGVRFYLWSQCSDRLIGGRRQCIQPSIHRPPSHRCQPTCT
eukprot:scaffold2532_cov84-Isochrysis_galbana.AAC.1